MKFLTLSLVALSAASLVSCDKFNNRNPYGAPAAQQPAQSSNPYAAQQGANPYAVPQANGETGAYAQNAPYQQIPGVPNNTLPPTQPPAVNHDYLPHTPEVAAPAAGSTLPYTVKPGDSLWKISREHGTSVQAIQAANGLTGSNIQAGQTLQIPNN